MAEARKVSLIIGIDKYVHHSLDSLESSKRDANELNEILLNPKVGYSNFRGSPIIGSNIPKDEVPRQKIRDTIIDFFNEAKPSQNLLFYFSGHGIHDGDDIYLATPEVDPENPMKSGFSLLELTKCMERSPSKQIIGIIDACYCGGAKVPDLKMKAAQDRANLALAKYRIIPKIKGVALLLSSQAYQESNAIRDSCSLYTKYLIEGLLGKESNLDQDGREIPPSVDKNGNVTPQTLHDYVFYYVATRAPKQAPIIKKDESSPLIITTYPQLAMNKKAKREEMDLTRGVNVTPRSWKLGSASSGLNVVIKAMEISLDRQGHKVELDPTDLEDSVNKTQLMDVGKFGIRLEFLRFVIDTFGVKRKKSKERYIARSFPLTSINDIPNQLSLKRPILTPVNVYENWFSEPIAKTGFIDHVDKKDVFRGFMLGCIVDCDPVKKEMKIITPWPNWGDRGLASLTSEAIKGLINGEFLISIEPVLKPSDWESNTETLLNAIKSDNRSSGKFRKKNS